MKTLTRVFYALIFLASSLVINGNTTTAIDINAKIFIHTDRSYYSTGESIYFKAYIFGSSRLSSDTLHISLIDQKGMQIAYQEFPVNNNLISGKMQLPDYETEGTYMLVASTGETRFSTEAMFSKLIEIRNPVESDLITYISLGDKVYEPGGMLMAKLKFMDRNNKPVSTGFTYQVTGINGKSLNGKGKSEKNGTAEIKIQLPGFDKTDTIRLLVTTTYKGTKSTSAVVLPEEINNKGIAQNSNESNVPDALNVNINAPFNSFSNNENMGFVISVTDSKGIPVTANLSVSVYAAIPGKSEPENENIISYFGRKSTGSLKAEGKSADNAFFTRDVKNYFARALKETTQAPGRVYLLQDENTQRKLQRNRAKNDMPKNEGYRSDLNIYDLLMQIKPYHMDNGKITFGIQPMNSVNVQDGAMIVVDGIKMGTDASILGTIPVPDIAHISASSNPMDIQKYSAFNNVGVIEITMKKSAEFNKPKVTIEENNGGTLFWGSDIITDNTGKTAVSFNSGESTEIIITVNGISAKGAYGGSSMTLTGR